MDGPAELGYVEETCGHQAEAYSPRFDAAPYGLHNPVGHGFL
jgi:hypothetical protein